MGTDGSPSRGPGGSDRLLLLAALPLASLVLAALEATRVDALPFWKAVVLATPIAALAAGAAAVAGAASALLPWFAAWRRLPVLYLQSAVAAVFGAALMVVLSGDEKLIAQPYVWVLPVGVVLAMVVELFLWRRTLPRAVRLVGALAVVLAAGLLWLGNYRFLPDAYPEIHHVGLLLTYYALAVALAWGLRETAASKRPLIMAAGSLVPVITLAVASLAFTDERGHVLADAISGQVAAKYSSGREITRRVRPVSADAQAFLRHHHLGALPEGFDLSNYDVLFIANEALRWDETSLGNPKLKTTPNLLRWEKLGATVYADAHAPSSGTLQSVASIFAMSTPACTALDVYKPHWSGTLREDATRVPVLFREDGRHTFWIGHNFRGMWDHKIEGFAKGFDHVDLTLEMNAKASRTADDETGDKLAKYLRGPLAKRFFGFSMFSGPHFRYVPHYDDMPKKTARQKYRHEVRKVDEQLGKVLDALKAAKRLDQTIVVITGDHGEEFREHGATGHNRTLWDESIRVPLVVWIPGVKGKRVAEPVSIAHVLPWLMLSSDGPLRAAGEREVARSLAPLAAATDGAVVSEIVGSARNIGALIWSDTKLVHDFVAGRTLAIDRRSDPAEKKPRYELTVAERRRLEGYLGARAGCEGFRAFGSRKPEAGKWVGDGDEDGEQKR